MYINTYMKAYMNLSMKAYTPSKQKQTDKPECRKQKKCLKGLL